MSLSRRCVGAGLLGAVPLLAEVPYIVHAWKTSPLDRFDAVFLPIFLAALTFVFFRLRRITADWRFDWMAAVLLLLGLGAWTAGVCLAVHAVRILGGMVTLFGAWSLASVRLGFARSVWAFALLPLMVTSSTYWLCSFFDLDVLVVRLAKTAWAVACLVALVRSDRKTSSAVPRRMELGWVVAVLLAVLAGTAYFCLRSSLLRSAEPFLPEFPATNTKGWLVREIAPDESFRRFFGTSDARQLMYATPSNTISVLTVACGGDVHKIHPATHCLRSSGWRIVSEALREQRIGDRTISLSEACVISPRGARALVWSWYSNATLSTGSFFCFRRHAREGGWHTYQIRIATRPDGSGDDAARRALVAFLERLGSVRHTAD